MLTAWKDGSSALSPSPHQQGVAESLIRAMPGRKVWVQDPRTGELIPQATWSSMLKGREGPDIIDDIGDFQNPQGLWLNGRRALRDDLARQNCHVYETGERQHIGKMREREERNDQRALRRRVAEIAAERGLGRPE